MSGDRQRRADGLGDGRVHGLCDGDPRQIKTASWNLWDAGSHVDGAQEKELRAILTDGLDVVGVQESGGTAAQALATALGWHAYQSSGDLGLVSRYPISAVQAPTAARPAVGATITVGTKTVRVWTAHLDEADYGPYAVCLTGRTAAAEVAAEKQTTRYAQAKALATAMAPDLKKSATVPVLLLGDLASPSQLDWTKATAAQHCSVGPLAWPVTVALAQAGLSDSYRVANPRPLASPGNTWSPVLKVHPGGTTRSRKTGSTTSTSRARTWASSSPTRWSRASPSPSRTSARTAGRPTTPLP